MLKDITTYTEFELYTYPKFKTVHLMKFKYVNAGVRVFAVMCVRGGACLSALLEA